MDISYLWSSRPYANLETNDGDRGLSERHTFSGADLVRSPEDYIA
jgi:hypothetical protein